MNPKKILILVIVVLCLIVLFQNTETVTLSFLFWKFSMSQIFLFPIVFGLGILVGYTIARLKGGRGEAAGSSF